MAGSVSFGDRLTTARDRQRNVGMDCARGRDLLFLDDALVTPDHLEMCEKGLPIAPLVLCWGRQVNSPLIRKDLWERVGDTGYPRALGRS
jgi:hypothetical protein